MAIPCSVNIYGLYLRLPLPFEVAFCDLKKVLRCYLLLSEAQFENKYLRSKLLFNRIYNNLSLQYIMYERYNHESFNL